MGVRCGKEDSYPIYSFGVWGVSFSFSVLLGRVSLGAVGTKNTADTAMDGRLRNGVGQDGLREEVLHVVYVFRLGRCICHS